MTKRIGFLLLAIAAAACAQVTQLQSGDIVDYTKLNSNFAWLNANKLQWAGAYSSGTSYPQSDVVSHSGVWYVSLQASNLNHQPDISGSWWQPIPGAACPTCLLSSGSYTDPSWLTLTWTGGRLTGIPSTFAPSSHASSHRNGGSDEVATATPAANAIPKAGSDGKLDPGWTTGGSGYVVLTTGTGAPSASCAAPSSTHLAIYLDSASGDPWWCPATDTWKKFLSVNPGDPYQVSGLESSSLATPAGGYQACNFDSTTHRQVCKDSTGKSYTMVALLGGTVAMLTTPVAADSCDASPLTATATGATDSDTAALFYHGDPTGVTGYGAGVNGGITIRAWFTTDTINFKRCNERGSSVTPGALSVNWGSAR